MKLVIATQNTGKIREISAILGNLPFEYLTLADLGLPADIPEFGETYAANALIKAIYVAHQTGLLALGDDSGLEVDALGGRPGLYSARYAATTPERWAKLLVELAEVPLEKRTARFRCAIAIAQPETPPHIAEGACEGLITFEPRGDGGFGYDPLFFIPEHNCTLAELPEEVKNRISHRGRALLKAKDYLAQFV